MEPQPNNIPIVEQPENSTQIKPNEGNQIISHKPIKEKVDDLKGISSIKIDVKGFIRHLTRKYGISIHYNNACWSQLQAGEIQLIYDVLFFLYNKRQEFIDTHSKKDGVPINMINQCKSSWTGKKISEVTIIKILWELSPVVLKCNSHQCKNKHIAKYFALNENGVILVERLIAQQKQGN